MLHSVLETSNLIALGALVIALIGLIPSFYQAFSNRQEQTKKAPAKSQFSEQHSLPESTTDSQDAKEEEPKPMPTMLRVIMLTAMGLGIGLIEFIVFGIVTHFFKVNIDFDTMSIVWKTIFYSLFIIPSLFFLLALTVFTTMFSD